MHLSLHGGPRNLMDKTKEIKVFYSTSNKTLCRRVLPALKKAQKSIDPKKSRLDVWDKSLSLNVELIHRINYS